MPYLPLLCSRMIRDSTLVQMETIALLLDVNTCHYGISGSVGQLSY